jgi:hypothetical protein
MELEWSKLGYVALCLLLPATWGGVTAWLFARLDARRAARRPERPPVDYTI